MPQNLKGKINMYFFLGIAFILATVGMIWVARPPQGQSAAPFLRVWIVGQAYVMAAMVSAVVGVALAIINWPSY